MMKQTTGTLSTTTSSLRDVYYRRYGIDISKYLESDTLTLEDIQPHGYFIFSGIAPGDGDFYAKLMGGMGYDDVDKPEFLEAAKLIESGDHVLDIGSGPGRFSKYCEHARYKGIDLNPLAVAEAQRQSVDVTLEPLEIQPSASFDVVTLFQVLEHVPSPEDFLQNAIDKLRAGGMLIISVPDLEGAIGAASNMELNYPPHHMSWWTVSSLRSLLELNGLAVTHVWHEPLRSLHFRAFASALVYRRDGIHFGRGLKFGFSKIVSRAIANVLKRTHKQIPFVRGHSFLIAAKKM